VIQFVPVGEPDADIFLAGHGDRFTFIITVIENALPVALSMTVKSLVYCTGKSARGILLRFLWLV